MFSTGSEWLASDLIPKKGFSEEKSVTNHGAQIWLPCYKDSKYRMALNESYWIALFGSKQLFCVRQSVGGNGLRDERVLIIT